MQTLCDWVNHCNAEGLEGLYDSPRTGRPTKLTETQKQVVVGWVIEGTPDREPDWKLESLQLKIKRVFGVSSSLEIVRCLLVRRGLHYITPQTHHSKADFEAQQQSRDAFSESAKKILPDGLDRNGFGYSLRTSRGLENARC